MDDSKQTEYKKWGASLRLGWTAVPNILLRKQSDLSLSSDHMIVLINLIRFWWRYDKFPYPSIEKTSNETGIPENKIIALINDLEQRGFLRKVGIGGGKYGYDLSPLSKMLSIFTASEETFKDLAIIISDDGKTAVDVISKDSYIGHKIDRDRSTGTVTAIRIDPESGNIEEYHRKFNTEQNKTAISVFDRWGK